MVKKGEARPFIFPWRRARRWDLNWRLVYMVAVSTLAHVAVFYLFQIAYPPSERWTPRVQGVMLLSSTDPVSSQVLRDLEDLTFHLRGTGSSEVPAYALNRLTPKFRPSFANHAVELRPFDPPARPDRLPYLFLPGHPDFPPLPSGSSGLPAGEDWPGEPALGITLTFDGAGRRFEVHPETREEIAALPGTWRWVRLRMAVGPDGRILHLIPDSVDDGSTDARLVELVRQAVRLSGGEDVQWGWLELRRSISGGTP